MRLSPITQTQAQFGSYVSTGTVLNNYAVGAVLDHVTGFVHRGARSEVTQQCFDVKEG